MIRILFFITNLSEGGAEKVLCNLVNNMDLSKFDITVQTVNEFAPQIYLADGIHYKAINRGKTKLGRACMSYWYRFCTEIKLTYPLYIKADYDIECAYLEMGPTKVIAASTNKKARKLAWVHVDLMNALSNPKGFAEKTAPWYAKFDQVVCVSQTAKQSFDTLFQNRFDSVVLRNVIDDDAIREKSLQPLPDNVNKRRFTVISVGRLSPQKKYKRLLASHKRLLDEGMEHDLWILGDGPERQMLEQYVSENDLQDSVWMPGYVENPYPFMHEADLLVCSSEYEGYSTFITEGVILGKPIVTTEVSGMRELLGDSEYGLIVDNNDESLYQGMKRMMTDTVLRERYGARAKLRGKDFSAEKLTSITEKFFENAVRE